MKYTRDKYFLLENDIVVFRNGDRGLVTKDNIMLQSGSFFLKHIYEKTNKFSPYIIEAKYDIIKIYRNNTSKPTIFFNLADNDEFLVWKENIPFPELKNGDVIVLNNDKIYMKVDNCFVCQFEGFVYVDHYDKNGENIAVDGEKWNIKQVYRKNKIKNFEIADNDKYLIWERS
jgi:hypothetical protein